MTRSPFVNQHVTVQLSSDVQDVSQVRELHLDVHGSLETARPFLSAISPCGLREFRERRILGRDFGAPEIRCALGGTRPLSAGVAVRGDRTSNDANRWYPSSISTTGVHALEGWRDLATDDPDCLDAAHLFGQCAHRAVYGDWVRPGASSREVGALPALYKAAPQVELVDAIHVFSKHGDDGVRRPLTQVFSGVYDASGARVAELLPDDLARHLVSVIKGFRPLVRLAKCGDPDIVTVDEPYRISTARHCIPAVARFWPVLVTELRRDALSGDGRFRPDPTRVAMFAQLHSMLMDVCRGFVREHGYGWRPFDLKNV